MLDVRDFHLRKFTKKLKIKKEGKFFFKKKKIRGEGKE